ncbi:MAG TPA: response regulator [Candidatus Ratteibacteria bacterium]|nr:response regulator [bacterium]HRR96356.1 response regulator [Candidatus Ratteibacteria bacterium]
MIKKKILIVEDVINEQILYKEELEKEGFEVSCVSNGIEAIEFVEKNLCDLVILDLHMPKMDGIETLGKLLTKKRNLPIVIYTAYPQYREQFLTWAADAYLIKNSDIDLLKNKVKDILSEK